MYDSDEHLGARSKLVLMKLGFDMRAGYEATLDEALPQRLQALADQLMGYAEWRDAPRDDTAR